MNKQYIKYGLAVIIIALLAWVVIRANKEPEQAAEPEVESNSPNQNVNAPVGENPEGEANPSVMTLGMKPWVWVSALYNDGKKLEPKVPGKFSITFELQDKFHASTDCNSISGTYKANEENSITFSNLTSTLMFCPGSQEIDFAKLLTDATGFHFTNKGELILELKFDSGTATFR